MACQFANILISISGLVNAQNAIKNLVKERRGTKKVLIKKWLEVNLLANEVLGVNHLLMIKYN